MNKLKGITAFLALALVGCSEEGATQLEAWLAETPTVTASDYGEPATEHRVLHSEDISHTARRRSIAWITAKVSNADSAIATAVSVALEMHRGKGSESTSVDFFQLKSDGQRAEMPLVTVEYSPDGRGFNGFDQPGSVIIKVIAAETLQNQSEIDAELMPSKRDISTQ